MMGKSRRWLYVRLLIAADALTELAFSAPWGPWRRAFVALANSIDALALRVAPPGMMDEPARAA